MTNCLELFSSVDLCSVGSQIAQTVSADNVDYFLNGSIPGRKGRRYYFNIKFRDQVPCDAIAELLADWIVELYEPKLREEMLAREFAETPDDRLKILDAAAKKTDLSVKFCNKRRIVKKITNYLKEEHEIQLDGFIRFRLGEYRQEVYLLLCEAIEEFYIEKEYEEFINLLSLYIDDRTPMIDLLHIKPESDGTFSFFDFRKSKIDVNIEKNEENYLIENFFTNEDMLVSILITLAPKRIIWHNSDDLPNRNIMNTVKEIFKERFACCEGCDICEIE